MCHRSSLKRKLAVTVEFRQPRSETVSGSRSTRAIFDRRKRKAITVLCSVVRIRRKQQPRRDGKRAKAAKLQRNNGNSHLRLALSTLAYVLAAFTEKRPSSALWTLGAFMARAPARRDRKRSMRASARSERAVLDKGVSRGSEIGYAQPFVSWAPRKVEETESLVLCAVRSAY